MAAEQSGGRRNPDGLEPFTPSPDGALIRRLNPQDVAQHFIANPRLVNHSFSIYEGDREEGKRGLIGEILHMAGTPDQVLHALHWGSNDVANYSLMAQVLGIPRWQAWMVTFTGRGDNVPQLDRAATALTEPETLIGETAPYVFSFWNLVEGYDYGNWYRMHRRLWRDRSADVEALTRSDPALSASLSGTYDPDLDFDRIKEDPSLAAIVASDAVLGDTGVGGPKTLVFNAAWGFGRTEYKLGSDFPMNWYRAPSPDKKPWEAPKPFEIAETIGHITALATDEVIGARVISEKGGTFTYLGYFENPEGQPLTFDWIQAHPYTPTGR